MKITIETIPNSQQRYPTVGDWYFADENGYPTEGNFATGHMVIRVSDLGSWREELCVAIHELVEVAIATDRGIRVADVDAFDMAYENRRQEKLSAAGTEAEKDLILIDEPGDDASCPIRREHCLATAVERLMAAELGVVWHEYELKIEHL